MRLAQLVGMVSSGFIYITWLLYISTSILELNKWYFKSNQLIFNSIQFYSILIWFIGNLIQLILFCFADSRSQSLTLRNSKFYKNKSPEIDSSFINQMCFWWFNPIPIIGAKKPLLIEDLFELNSDYLSANLIPLWIKYWLPVYQRMFYPSSIFFRKSN